MKLSDCKNRFPIFKERLETLKGDMSNTEFASFLGMSRQTVGFYLNGERIPDILGLRQIAEKCNVSADWLIDLSGTPERDAELQQVCQYTGLSGESVQAVRTLAKRLPDNFLDVLFSDRMFPAAIFTAYDYKVAKEAYRFSSDARAKIFKEVLKEEGINDIAPHLLLGKDRDNYDKAVQRADLRHKEFILKFCENEDAPQNLRDHLRIIYEFQNEDNPLSAYIDTAFSHIEPREIYRNQAEKHFTRLLARITNKDNKPGYTE